MEFRVEVPVSSALICSCEVGKKARSSVCEHCTVVQIYAITVVGWSSTNSAYIHTITGVKLSVSNRCLEEAIAAGQMLMYGLSRGSII